jgi:hypothetical protein
MALAGLDHVVIAVHDLDGAARDWTSLGFTLSPRGVHSAHMGTVNHTIMLGPDYLELLGVATATDGNRATREFLGRDGEGIERLAFRTTDAAADADAVRATGIAATGPVAFSRPVARPGGSSLEAAFRVFYWPDDARVAGMRIFACEHRTPQAVWLPELQRHANGATRVLRIERFVGDPATAARALGALVGTTPIPIGDARDERGPTDWRIRTAEGRADIDFRAATKALADGAARLVVGSNDRAVIDRPAWRGNGIELAFEEERDDRWRGDIAAASGHVR